MPKCDFNKVAKQINLLHISLHLFMRTPLEGCFKKNKFYEKNNSIIFL